MREDSGLPGRVPTQSTKGFTRHLGLPGDTSSGLCQNLMRVAGQSDSIRISHKAEWQALQHKTPNNRRPDTEPLATLCLKGLQKADVWNTLRDLPFVLPSPLHKSLKENGIATSPPLFYEGGQWPARARPTCPFFSPWCVCVWSMRPVSPRCVPEESADNHCTTTKTSGTVVCGTY